MAESAEEIGFEDALHRLERTVQALEGGELDLDQALAQYEQGVHLLVRCRSMLDDAERKVALLTGVDPDGTPQTAPFDATATAEGKKPKARPAQAAFDEVDPPF